MIKKKSKMNKIIMWGLIATASVSLASVGFASWVINTIVPSDNKNINVSVGEVGTKSLTASVTSAEADLKVSFDHDNKGTNFTNEHPETEKEKLDFTIKTTITTAENVYISKVLSKLEYKFTIGTALSDLINKNAPEENTKYINTPSFIGANNISTVTFNWNETANSLTSTTLTPDNTPTFTVKPGTSGVGNTFVVNATFKFEWGAAFKNTNPASTITDTTLTKEVLGQRLQAFKAAYDKVKTETFLSVVVTPVVKQ